ncbi:AAA family ATPase [Asticcacaulis sp. BYS171W]|uniref:AAA family ATPase n=1 Tax=Asticcacaulis aquaticus TaxID=2984212 RepID=A0ABT5HX06_9CAUL|nr:AAA family ATPase [Asticcacaulis aquaticus]MDC7684519.1 AAA family ATPase [Asticcacaulis aquaticus]
MAIISRIKTLKGVGILADKTAKDLGAEFLRYNLVYGFNGSGKSTLSRVFACLEAGEHNEALPDQCAFEIEMDNSQTYSSPKKLGGLENRICVFNVDFVDRNLQWGVGRANSIFYISKQQADLAGELQAAIDSVPAGAAAKEAQSKVVSTTEKAVKSYRTERAKLVSSSLHLGNRRYEAGQLQSDYEKLPTGPESVLGSDELEALIEIARLTAPAPTLPNLAFDPLQVLFQIERARAFGKLSIGQVVLDELESHPAMVRWIKEGYDYHVSNALDNCLLCGNSFSVARKETLAAALDEKISSLMGQLNDAHLAVRTILEGAISHPKEWPTLVELDPSLQASYVQALNDLTVNFQNTVTHLREAERIIQVRLAQPTSPVEFTLPDESELTALFEELAASLTAVNNLIDEHNTATANFAKRQEEARENIRKHFLAEGKADYVALVSAHSDAERTLDQIDESNSETQRKIRELSAKVKSHGLAAEQITSLMRTYLGHGELAIVAVADGYELHRHGKLVRGQPSEGEKTAIALCYFLSTLEADGRSLKELIVVIDDPISSLDTKAMNYACALIRNRLSDVRQLFILTHNPHCMNEFKKAWRNWSKAENDKPAKAKLLFMDVRMPATSGLRTASIIEMPSQLRGYDSEYHFLYSKMLEFEAVGEGHSEYWFMMPNAIRRVLEIFLAFKVPGSHPISQKLDALAKRLGEFDKARIIALERLTQVESHSDSLDDLITHSAMTVEETRDANAALLALVLAADAEHATAMRSQCRPT